ncbi:hypothetical protein FKW77_000564 [Venturia effusa]|uniref:Heterokaryon incompatibility domain-containing protein n=1 Tax=Venturia effusa TaxID=50376 RepID=A0A517L8F6_9PEZI|nr:hypothetical protein FKW77_000564 [Venturia effusa]
MSNLISLARRKAKSRLCLACGDLEPIDDGHVESRFKAICAAAKKGCESCSLLRHAIHGCLPEAIVADTQSSIVVVVRRSILREFVEIAVRFAESAKTEVLDLFVSPNTFSPWPSIRIGVETSGNTVSLASFRLVEEWLSECLQKHNSCGAKTRPALPTRVLDLFSLGSDLSLCEPQTKDERYACLSHCWGDARTTTTTLGNLEAHKALISFSILPKTFQEAIIFTRKLGIQYLWIDSLCIIQDDEEDWQKESAKMASIYQNSSITIAATGSSGPGDGLFSKHPKTNIRGVFRNGTGYQVHARPVIDHMDGAQFPLLRRGWVYQERLLAPRVLHFGRQELWWECLEMVQCECSGIVKGDRYATGQEKFLTKLTHQSALSNSELAFVSRRWHAIVEEFSQLSLTKSRDKLPALSGIAQQISHMREGTYLAGLWTDTIQTDLLWFRLDPSTAQRTAKWRCPTFSWASHDGPVRYFDAPHVLDSPSLHVLKDMTQPLSASYLEVSKASSRLVSKNSFGEVSAAHLLLKGLLAPIHVFDARTPSVLSTSTQALSRRTSGRRRRGLVRSNFEFRFDDEEPPLKYSFFADFDLHSADPGFAREKYVLLRVAQDSHGDEYALVLKCIELSQGICERVGLFTPKFSRWRSADHSNLYRSNFTKAGKPRELMLV